MTRAGLAATLGIALIAIGLGVQFGSLGAGLIAAGVMVNLFAAVGHSDDVQRGSPL